MNLVSTNHKANYMRGRPLIHLAITAYRGHQRAVTRIPCNYNGNCAYANGLPRLG